MWAQARASSSLAFGTTFPANGRPAPRGAFSFHPPEPRMATPPEPGRLLVVATPIGNLGDLSPRAREALAAADLVAAEDTRRTGNLLRALGIEGPPLVSCHRFNEAARVGGVLSRLREGRTVALVTDGGTPAISDPGWRLVAAAHREGIPVSPIPGPAAAVAALSAAGLPGDRFRFAGFLPSRSPARRRFLADLAGEPDTLVFHESPHRLAASLADLADVLGEEREAVLCRELTKLHEEVRRDTLGRLASVTAGRDRVRGEVVLVVAGAREVPRDTAREDDVSLLAAFARALAREEGDVRRAVRVLARDSGRPRAEITARLRRLGALPAGGHVT